MNDSALDECAAVFAPIANPGSVLRRNRLKIRALFSFAFVALRATASFEFIFTDDQVTMAASQLGFFRWQQGQMFMGTGLHNKNFYKNDSIYK